MYGRLNRSQDVLGAMFGFPGQSGDLPLALLALGDVLEAIDRAENIPVAVLERADVDEHDAARAIRTFDHDLLVLHGLATAENLAHRTIGVLYYTAVEMVHAV